MMVEEPDLYWEKGGPSLNFRCRFTGGKYYVWLLMRFDDPSNDAVTVGIDGNMLRIDRIYLTKGKELPPDDLHFTASPRKES